MGINKWRIYLVEIYPAPACEADGKQDFIRAEYKVKVVCVAVIVRLMQAPKRFILG